jgi:ABC-type antimicrobial peptide transport system permease subunit
MLASGMRQTIASAGDATRAIVMQHDQWSESASVFDQSVLAQVAAAPGIRRDDRGQPLVTGELVASHILGVVSGERLSTIGFGRAAILAAFSSESMPLAVLVAVGVGVLGGTLPAIRAARMSPVTAMRP